MSELIRHEPKYLEFVFRSKRCAEWYVVCGSGTARATQLASGRRNIPEFGRPERGVAVK